MNFSILSYAHAMEIGQFDEGISFTYCMNKTLKTEINTHTKKEKNTLYRLNELTTWEGGVNLQGITENSRADYGP